MPADASSGLLTSEGSPEHSVLLVNDTPSLRRLKHLHLVRAGYIVVEALNGQEALEYLRASSAPLVVVMNTNIPVLNAAGILQTVVAEPRLQQHTFVVTTAISHLLSEDLRLLTKRLQAQILGKPFTEQELLSVVANAVEQLRAALVSPEDPTSADQD